MAHCTRSILNKIRVPKLRRENYLALFALQHQIKPTAIIETYPDIFNVVNIGILLNL